MRAKHSMTCAMAALGALLLGALPADAASPAFKIDPYWPKSLPHSWILGQVGGLAVDAQDRIQVLQRPRSLTDDEKGAALSPPLSKCCVPAPSVLVFNQDGDVVKSWGGPGENLGYDWPLQEHAILVDATTTSNTPGMDQTEGNLLQLARPVLQASLENAEIIASAVISHARF